MKDTHKQKLLAVTGLAEIGFIAEGMEATVTGHVISEDALILIAEALEAADANAATNAEIVIANSNAATALAAAQEELTASNTNLTTSQSRIEELEARVNELEADGSITATSRGKDEHGKNKVAAHEDPNNSINQIADRLFGTPPVK